MRSIGSLFYQDTAAIRNRFANLDLDTDYNTDFRITLNGTDFNGNFVVPHYVQVDNFDNIAPVNVTVNGVTNTVAAYTRTTFEIAGANDILIHAYEGTVKVYISETKLGVGDGSNSTAKDGDLGAYYNRDGSNPLLADLDFGGKKGSNLADPVADNDAVSLGSLKKRFKDATKLGGDLGAGSVGFIPSAIAAVYTPGSVGDRLAKTVYASDWDIRPDGTDQYAKIQAMINSGAGSRYVFPAKGNDTVYVCNGTVTVPSHVSIEGQSASASIIKSNVTNQPIFSVIGQQRVIFSRLRCAYDGVVADGANAIYIQNCYFCDFRDVWCENVCIGINFDDNGYVSGNHSIKGYRCFNFLKSGLRFFNVIDINISHFRIDTFDPTLATDASIVLEGGCEALNFSQGDVTRGRGPSLAMRGVGGSTARGLSPFSNKFSQVFFDSPKAQCALLRQSTQTTFIDCWFASAGHDEVVGFGSALDIAGVDMSQCTKTKFIGGEFYNNGGRGLLHYSDNKYTVIMGVSVSRNQYTRAANGAGIEFLGGSTDFMVKDCLFERDADQVKYRQLNAVLVNGGASDRYVVADNLLGGCALFDGGSGANKRVASNY